MRRDDGAQVACDGGLQRQQGEGAITGPGVQHVQMREFGDDPLRGRQVGVHQRHGGAVDEDGRGGAHLARAQL